MDGANDLIKKMFAEQQKKREDNSKKEESKTAEQPQPPIPPKDSPESPKPQYEDDFIQYFKELVVDNGAYEKKYDVMNNLGEKSNEPIVNMYEYRNENKNNNSLYNVGAEYDHKTQSFLDLINLTTNAILSSKKEGKGTVALLNDISDFIRHYKHHDDKGRLRIDAICNAMDKALEPIEIDGKKYVISSIFRNNFEKLLGHIQGSKQEMPEMVRNITADRMATNATMDMFHRKFEREGDGANFDEKMEEFFKYNIESNYRTLKTNEQEKLMTKINERGDKIREKDNTVSDPDVKKFEKGIKEELKDLFIEPLVQMFSFLSCLIPFDETKQDLIKQGTDIGQKLFINPIFDMKEYVVDKQKEVGKTEFGIAKSGNDKFKQALETSFKKVNKQYVDAIDKIKKIYDYSRATEQPDFLRKDLEDKRLNRKDKAIIELAESNNENDSKIKQLESERKENKISEEKFNEKKKNIADRFKNKEEKQINSLLR